MEKDLDAYFAVPKDGCLVSNKACPNDIKSHVLAKDAKEATSKVMALIIHSYFYVFFTASSLRIKFEGTPQLQRHGNAGIGLTFQHVLINCC
jgi:hypothetical protein